MFEYATLKVLWWGVVLLLVIGFAIMDGFDLGVGALLPFLGRTDSERRVLLNSIGPHWEGNQVWFITAGGAVFAAWPLVYATAFSGFYFAMILVLWSLFFRPVGFDYRSKTGKSSLEVLLGLGTLCRGSRPSPGVRRRVREPVRGNRVSLQSRASFLLRGPLSGFVHALHAAVGDDRPGHDPSARIHLCDSPHGRSA